MLFIRPALGIVRSGELLQLPIILRGASTFTVENVESSICSSVVPYDSLAGLCAPTSHLQPIGFHD